MAKFQAIICHRSFVEIKIYVAGAIPGKSLKRKTTESDDKREKTKKYEQNRKAPKFNVKWLTNPEWLDYDESNDIMTCKDDDDDDFCEDWRTGACVESKICSLCT
jgi:hypothetical protein